MALFLSGLKRLTNLITQAPYTFIGSETQQVRHFIRAKMKRDMKRRACAKEYAPMRVRLVSMKRNDILPEEIRQIASEDMAKVPRRSALFQLTNRCVVTNRGRAVLYKWRVSRIVFRHLADHNNLAGIQRAIW
ncbi:small ribosomal subunit protein uS14m [Prorops nasuta]|uniref:small ribosomal subunit protein uS14m n=1 Tax=Prorops nasuta TaxID=863751 RepID=UPI0034CE4456